MQEGKLGNNQQMEENDILFPPSHKGSSSHNQHRELGVAPPSALPLGDVANGINEPFNNIQCSMWNPFEPSPQTLREHDLHIPITNVVQIMRRGLPPHAKVDNEAKEMVQECVSEFINFFTSEANYTCQLEHRKIITAEDIIGAMSWLGFEQYVEPLSIYLQKYRESEILPLMSRPNVGHISTEGTAITSTTNGLPPFVVVHPQFAAMFGTSVVHGWNYHNGLGTSFGSMNMDHGLDLMLNPLEPNPQTLREHDLYIPIENVVKIMRRGLPPHAKVVNEAKKMVQECVSEFINFITSEANYTCQREHRKTITTEDVLGAMSRLGFEQYVEPLSIYLQKYRESEILPLMPRSNVGHISNEVTAITSTTNVLPQFVVIHPEFAAMFGTSVVYGWNYHDGLGTSFGSMNMGYGLDFDIANVCDDDGSSLALGNDDGPNGSEEGSPSRPPKAELEFYYPYGHC